MDRRRKTFEERTVGAQDTLDLRREQRKAAVEKKKSGRHTLVKKIRGEGGRPVW